MKEGADKRQFRRIGCRIESWFKAKTKEEPGAMTMVFDISEGGVRFRSHAPLSPQEEYYLALDLPGRDPLDSYVKPVWSRKNSLTHDYITGAAFVHIHPEDRGVVRNLVQSKL